MLKFESLTEHGMRHVCRTLCPADRAEVEAAGHGVNHEDEMVDAALKSQHATQVLWRGNLCAAYGMALHNDTGIPWLLCTDVAAQVPRLSVFRHARAVVAQFQRSRKRLANVVHSEHSTAVRFVKALGFTVTDVQPRPHFFWFHWEASPCATQSLQ